MRTLEVQALFPVISFDVGYYKCKRSFSSSSLIGMMKLFGETSFLETFSRNGRLKESIFVHEMQYETKLCFLAIKFLFFKK